MRFTQSKLFFLGLALAMVYVSLGPMIFGLYKHSPETIISLGILDKDNLTKNYFTNTDGIVNINETNSWNIYLYNNPARTQYVALRVKMAGGDTSLPDSETCEPCPSPAIYEVRQVIGKDSAITLPFTWKIIEADSNNSNYIVNKVQINGEEVTINASGPVNQDMLIIFELWLYDSTTNDFSFKWYSRGDSQCVWNYLRFRPGV